MLLCCDQSLTSFKHSCSSDVLSESLCSGFQVIANMNAAYKQEKKKNAKRKTHNVPSMAFKITDPLFGVGDSPSPKKLKESLYLSFPVETVLATEQGGSEDMKTELAFRLAESDVHWGGQLVSVDNDSGVMICLKKFRCRWKVCDDSSGCSCWWWTSEEEGFNPVGMWHPQGCWGHVKDRSQSCHGSLSKMFIQISHFHAYLHLYDSETQVSHALSELMKPEGKWL